MLCGRSNEADGRNGGAYQRYEEDMLLERIDLLKAGREGKGEQEREQDLDAGKRHPKPLQQLTGVDQAKQLLAADAASRPTFLLDNLRQLDEPYPTTSTREDPGSGERVITVAEAGSRSIDLLRAGCAAIWDSGMPIYALEVPPQLYE